MGDLVPYARSVGYLPAVVQPPDRPASADLAERVVEAVEQLVAGGAVVGQREIELGAHRVEEDAAAEQPQHQGAALRAIAAPRAAIVEHRVGGEDDLRHRAVAHDL